MKIRATFTATLLCFSVSSISGIAVAQDRNGPIDFFPDVSVDEPMTEDHLIAVFSGQTHSGTYNFLNRDITSFEFEEETAADGSITHRQQHRVDTGNWTIKGNVICYDYDDPELSKACFNIYARGNCYYHHQVSVRGQERFGFTARSVIKGDIPNCEPSFV